MERVKWFEGLDRKSFLILFFGLIFAGSNFHLRRTFILFSLTPFLCSMWLGGSLSMILCTIMFHRTHSILTGKYQGTLTLFPATQTTQSLMIWLKLPNIFPWCGLKYVYLFMHTQIWLVYITFAPKTWGNHLTNDSSKCTKVIKVGWIYYVKNCS